jgi:hypothetical protein
MGYARKFRNMEGCRFMIGVGAQKAGTTWLFEYLGRHPDMAMSPIKELHYFDQIFRPDLCGIWVGESNKRASQHIQALAAGQSASISELQYLIDRVRMNSEPDSYLEYFDRLATHGRPVLGEITPSYCLLPAEGFIKMRQTIENAGAEPRIVFIMRDPARRFWSQCRFNAGLEPGRKSIAQIYRDALTDPNFIERTRYDWTVPRLLKSFAVNQVLFLFYEDLFSAPMAQRLCEFLQIGYRAPPASQRIHVSAPAPLDPSHERELRALFKPVYTFAADHFGAAVPAQWQGSA